MTAPSTPAPGASAPAAPRNGWLDLSWHRVKIVARSDMRQLLEDKGFWMPMVFLGAIFFLIIPTVLLLTITKIGDVSVVNQMSQTLKVLPPAAQEQIQGQSPEGKTAYALAVFLLAPIAIVVPLTISTAIGASTIVGERERGTGEFLAHSPAHEKEIYLGKLIASLVPGYATTLIGFGVYSIIVNLLVGPEVGGWFFPTSSWWTLMLWVVPPFLALTLSIVLRLSARVKSTAAAQQAAGLVTLPMIAIAYSQSTGALFGASSAGLFIGLIAWVLAIIGLSRGMRAVSRSRLLGVNDGV
ncbi:ABC transporter permease subunit [Aquihabitans sp. McL0605]|uniref:ABC transporter permease subunit n=1 Tax=Aquihabitans sp. McL0605 TaxID=3415671 RepID=UPI003CF62360